MTRSRRRRERDLELQREREERRDTRERRVRFVDRTTPNSQIFQNSPNSQNVQNSQTVTDSTNDNPVIVETTHSMSNIYHANTVEISNTLATQLIALIESPFGFQSRFNFIGYREEPQTRRWIPVMMTHKPHVGVDFESATRPFLESSRDLESCAICLESSKEMREIKKCRHVYCSACISKWFSEHSTCPVCRADVNV